MMTMALFTLILCLALTAGHMTQGRVKRSDDPLPLAAVVSQQSALLDKIMARLGFLDGLETRVKFLETIQASLRHHAAFSVRFSSTYAVSPINAPLKFDHVIFNDGNAYDPVRGVFTAPVSGFYIFSVQILPHGDERSMLDLYANGALVSRMVADSSGAEPETSGVSTVVVRLRQNDKVWVQAASGAEFYSGVHSFFNGALLYADYPLFTPNGDPVTTVPVGK